MKQNIKEKSVKYFAVFLAFMLVCTIVSRGIYAYQMPQVSVGASKSQKINHSIEVSGSISAGSEHPLNLLPGLRIREICVREGQKVETGEVLLKVDVEDLKELKKQSEDTLTAAKTRLSDLQANDKMAKDAKNTAIVRANQDLENARTNTDAAVSNADSAYQAAKDALSSYPAWEDYWKKTKKEDAEYQKLLKTSKKKEATKEEKEAVLTYESSLEAKARDEYEAGKKALEDEVSEKEAAVVSANDSRADEMQRANRALEDAKKTADGEQSSLLEQQQEIEKLQKINEEYQALLEKDGEIKSDAESYISRILTAAGDRTADAASLMLTDDTGDYLFTAILTREQRGDLNIGDTAQVVFERKATVDFTVESIVLTEEGNYQAAGKIPGEGLAFGESGTLKIDRQTQTYPCCVPLSALYAENGITYILLAEEQDTILGKEWTAKKRNVKVVDKDGEYAALEGSPLTENEKLIVGADRRVKDGQKIRLLEED